MFRAFFQIPGQLQQILPRRRFSDTFRKDKHIGHVRLALRDRSGLIEQNGIDPTGRFQSLRRFNENAVGSPPACAHHNGRGRGQTKGAGAGDHEDGDGVGESELHAFPGEEPDEQGHRGDKHDDRDKNAADFVGQPCHRSFGSGGFIDQTNNLG